MFIVESNLVIRKNAEITFQNQNIPSIITVADK